MARTFDSPRHDALREFLVKKRKEAGLRQVDLAKRLKRRQDYISYVETGQKLVEVVASQPSSSRARKRKTVRHHTEYLTCSQR
jgi:predicted transcriptional regulator